MRNSVRVILSLSLVCFALGVARADERVNVPFNFIVNGKSLPAGTYIIRHTSLTNPNAVLLDGGPNKIVPISVSAVDLEKTGAQMVFDNRGEDRVLKSLATAHGTLSVAEHASKRVKKGQPSAAVTGN
jgi:hypothetical protein